MTKIIITDDHQLFRSGLKLLIDSYDEFEVTKEVGSGKELVDLMRQMENVDDYVILLDIAMPEMDGIAAAEKCLELHPNLNIIALTMFGDEDYSFSMVKIGAKGFLLKNSDISEVIDALKVVSSGGSYFSRELLTSLVNNIVNSGNTLDDVKQTAVALSDREIEVVNLICSGYTTGEIANNMEISKRTVDKHRANILEKTGAKNSAELVVYAIKNKITTI